MAAALVADAICRIEARRDALDELAAKGIAMLDQIVAGEIPEIAGRKPFRDPARAFAVISRAVRLCLSLASRLDEALIALLRGGPIPNLAILRPDAPAPAPTAHAADTVIEAERGDAEVVERVREVARERLIEREHHDAYLHLPWRVVVGKIRAELGLRSDLVYQPAGQSPPKPAHPGECRDPDRRSGFATVDPLPRRDRVPGAYSP